jgi:carbon-monoxide dehydrogenase medium subunit
MKPTPFAYRKATSVAEAAAWLHELGDEAKVLAGGQSLVPMMNLRLAAPTALVDINDVPGLAGIRWVDGELRLGALVRHRHLEAYPAALPGFAVLPKAARFIGHYGVRDRGSVGGSIAHADSTAEWCLMAALFDAEIHVVGVSGPRVVRAEDFFQGFLATSLHHDEVVVEVRLPRGATYSAIHEFAQRHGDFAVVAAAAAFDMVDGRLRNVRLVLGGVAGSPVRAREAEQLLQGEELGDELIAEAGAVAAAGVDPVSDGHASSDYRRRLTQTLLVRALREALATGPDPASSRTANGAA